MRIHTFVEQITKVNSTTKLWGTIYSADDNLNTFLQEYKEDIISVESYVNTIDRHNNGGFDTLVKTTVVMVRTDSLKNLVLAKQKIDLM